MSKKKHILTWLAVAGCLFLLLTVGGGQEPMSVEAATSSEIAEEIEELEKKSDEIQAEIDALRGQLNENMENLAAMMAQKNLVDQEMSLLYQQTQLVNDQIVACTNLIADKQEELDQAQTQLKKLQEENKARIRAMEENGELSYWSVLAEANTFSEMLDHLELVR